MTGRSAGPLASLLAAQTLAVSGNVVTLIALPLYVLAETGSAVMAGVLAVATTVPVVLGGAFGGVLVDRFGYRRSSVVSDVVGGVTVGAIPLLHATVGVPIPVLLALVFATGLLDTPGQAARTALVPEAAALARVPLERAMGWWGAAERGARLAGAPLAGLLVAWIGPLPVLVVNAATFGLSALVVAAGVPAGLRPADDDAALRPAAADDAATGPARTGGGGSDRGPAVTAGYWTSLAEGVRVLWRNRLLRAVTVMVFATNALDIGRSSVILPVYATRELAGAASFGLLVGASGLGALAGALLFSVVGTRLPRRATYATGFLLGGPPMFFVLAARPGLGWCLVATVLAGLASGALNPIIGTVTLEQVPASMRARVQGVVGAGAWAAMPAGALLTGLLVQGLGVIPSLLLCGGCYLLATLPPFFGGVWAGLDRGAPGAPGAATVAR